MTHCLDESEHYTINMFIISMTIQRELSSLIVRLWSSEMASFMLRRVLLYPTTKPEARLTCRHRSGNACGFRATELD